MAEVQPPSYLQNGAHSALSDRLTLSSMLQPGATGLASRGGVRASGDGLGMAVVAAGTANNTVVVKAGTAYVPEADGTGVYIAHNDADRTLTVPSASTTQSRRDLVVAQINDSTYSGSTDNWALTIVQGTPSSGTPVTPTAPANSLTLADYLVPAGSTTTVTNANINDRRSVLVTHGGVMPVLSTALPVSPFKGMTVWCTDTEAVQAWNGSAWRVQSFYPLPDPIKLFSNTSQVLTSAAGVFTTLPTRLYFSITLARPTWVLLGLHAWMRAAAPADLRATLAITGATTGPGTGGVLLDPAGNYGEVLQSSVDATSIQCGMSVPMKFNSGTTSIEIVASRSSTGGGPQLNYPAVRVTPLRYA